jgi:hypothetical protein
MEATKRYHPALGDTFQIEGGRIIRITEISDKNPETICIFDVGWRKAVHRITQNLQYGFWTFKGNTFMETQVTPYSPASGDILIVNNKRMMVGQTPGVAFFTIGELAGTFTTPYILDAIAKGHWLVYSVARENRKLTGYVQLKDLPGIPAGTAYDVDGKPSGFLDITGVDPKWLKNEEWFQPVYETPKPLVRTEAISNNRIINVTAQGTTLDSETIDHKYLDQLIHAMLEERTVFTTHGTPRVVYATSFKVGCQELTREDLLLILKLRKEFK